MTTTPPASARSRQAGFTLIELVVGMVVLSEVLLGALLLFDVNSKLAKTQIQITDLQQGLRTSQHELVRTTRMAGRGSLPLGTLPDGLAIAVVDNVAEDTKLAVGDPEGHSPIVAEGTDVLRIRGVISTSLYQVSVSTVTDDSATITVTNFTKDGIPQNLQALEDAIVDELPEAIVVTSKEDDAVYAIGELQPALSSFSDTEIILQIDFGTPGSDSRADQYLALSPNGEVPSGLTQAPTDSVNFVGILEEYKFYVRADYVIEDDPSSEATPKFAMARLFPGTETGHGSSEEERKRSLEGDLADNVIDFQVALGVDADDDDAIASSEWVYSDPAAPPEPAIVGDLHYLRLNILVRTDRRDFQYQAENLTAIENRDYDSSSPENTREEKMYRRRSIQTIVQLRNL